MKPFLYSIILFISFGLPPSWSHEGHHHHDEPSNSDAEKRILSFNGSKNLKQAQKQVRRNKDSATDWLALGWAFVEEARSSQNEAIYNFSLVTADLHDERFGKNPDSMLLRGHTLLQHHKFDETLDVCNYLIRERGNQHDYALLGDALLEKGNLTQAETAYHRMARHAFGFDSIVRFAWLRWQQGEIDAAITLWTQALEAVDPSKSERNAWTAAQLGEAHFQSGSYEYAATYAHRALAAKPDSAHAHFLKGRLLQREGKYADSIAHLSKSVSIDPLPERLWWLETAYREAGDLESAHAIRSQILTIGPSIDRRATALYRVINDLDTDRALKLVKEELKVRKDPYTLSVQALCLSKAGRSSESAEAAKTLIASGFHDGRKVLGAGLIDFHEAMGTLYTQHGNRTPTLSGNEPG